MARYTLPDQLINYLGGTVHVLFLAWTVANSHYPALFVGGFLFFLGFMRATAPYQSLIELRAPLLEAGEQGERHLAHTVDRGPGRRVRRLGERARHG